MDFVTAVKHAYSNYATFSGRARRPAYWWFALFLFIASILIGLVEMSLGMGQGEMMAHGGRFSMNFSGGPLSAIWWLVNLLPALAVGARRLHDTDRSGWWLLIGIIPLIGAIVLIVFMASKGTAGPNRFGNEPTV